MCLVFKKWMNIKKLLIPTARYHVLRSTWNFIIVKLINPVSYIFVYWWWWANYVVKTYWLKNDWINFTHSNIPTSVKSWKIKIIFIWKTTKRQYSKQLLNGKRTLIFSKTIISRSVLNIKYYGRLERNLNHIKRRKNYEE